MTAVERVVADALYGLAHDVFGYTVRETRVRGVWIHHSDGAASSFTLHD